MAVDPSCGAVPPGQLADPLSCTSRRRAEVLCSRSRVVLTTNQLRALIADGESDRVELTVSTGNTNKFGEAIIGANFVVFPLAPDLFSLQALGNVGPTLREWRNAWQDRLERRPAVEDLELPSADILPAGYIVMQHAVRAGRPVQACQKWIKRIPDVYRKEALDEVGDGVFSTDDDSECLATLKHYRSLMAMAHEARKPMFHLKAADGALGGHIYAVQDCYRDFEKLAIAIAAKCDVRIE